MTTSTVDQLVAEYLTRLDVAAASLPSDRRTELLEEIGGHIASARAAGAAADEAAVRTLLDRLGPPEVIVAAAFDDDPAAGTAPPAPRYGGAAPGQPQYARPGTGLELAAVVMLTAGSVLLVIGWLAGVALLWSSSRWRTAEKLLGTLVVPLGPGGVLLTRALLPDQTCTVTVGGTTLDERPAPPGDGTVLEPSVVDGLGPVTECTGFALPPALGWALLALAVVAPVVVAVVLYRRAVARAAAEPPRLLGPSPWGGLEIGAVLALALGSVVVPLVGPVIGLVLAWMSPKWTTREKGVATALCVVPLVLFVLLPVGGLLLGGLAL